MDNPIILVQAASRAWSGAPDWCMNEVDGRPVVALTIENGFKEFPAADVRIIAPEFDRGGRLDELPAMFPENKVSVFYGFDESPLERMIAALEDAGDHVPVIRVDGLHFGWLTDHARTMLNQASKNGLDCVKTEDDFPIQLTSDIYRPGALKKALSILEERSNGAAYRVHPKFFMFTATDKFKCARVPGPAVSEEWLKKCRETAEQVYIAGNMNVDSSKSINAGDQLSFHYEMALDYIGPDAEVLDCGCGPGYGSRMLADKAKKVVAADLDIETVRRASSGKYYDNITFQTGDATSLGFEDNCFDAVTSFETVEHVDPAPYFKEMRRVLKPGGLLILSTPQNSLGHIPVNSQHLHEFSLQEISGLCSEHFEIVKTTGIKQGRIIFPDDPKGQNTFMVCRKKI
ncbi:bifunctional 2-polyprenyl-6-hydroxyphenol methylase/3-demethylubiquinol 3-O-methyltransferase UbiG [Desulfovibrio sp. JC010]|uniref:class I SAM-dependent methyltransferase n=1 Tax=Desulfovibrio sp. JC010 TaxID=2593641 RepID=UPI0013D30387|nr:methyltransferase domain-containing protein [Desulfovibrio sp. JC010]NDV26671.1 methyltransferase domain-containing protein [Desulfovibrio sp. JC010]